ncbi:MAG: RNA polymerase sigma factor [Planctomycetota bacterium JB042]
MNRPDSDLLVRLRDGDLDAFDEIVERFERRLIGYFRSLCGDPQTAEDCAQEVFVRLYRARDRYSPDAALSTFVFRIAKNYWIDVYRSRRARPDETSLDRTGAEGEEDSMADTVASDEPGPADAVVGVEDHDRLRAAMERLPEIQRSVLALAGGQGLKYEQVAEVLGIPVGTVKSRVHAAVANLRRLMGVPEEASGDEETRRNR